MNREKSVKKTIGVIGGDLRQRFAVETIDQPIVFFANESIVEGNEIMKVHNLTDVISNCDIILVPIPFSRDNKNLYVRYYMNTIDSKDLFDNLTKGKILIGGPFSKEMQENIRSRGVKFLDMTTLESFKQKNAIPTSEGVIGELISKLDRSIHKSKGLVLGYGYCGKRISKSLSELGAFIDIYTENPPEIEELYKNNLELVQNFKNIRDYNYIINTIPHQIIDEKEILSDMDLFIDITEAYPQNSTCFVNMRGIPGRLFPRTAGKIVGELLNEIVKSILGGEDQWKD